MQHPMARLVCAVLALVIAGAYPAFAQKPDGHDAVFDAITLDFADRNLQAAFRRVQDTQLPTDPDDVTVFHVQRLRDATYELKRLADTFLELGGKHERLSDSGRQALTRISQLAGKDLETLEALRATQHARDAERTAKKAATPVEPIAGFRVGDVIDPDALARRHPGASCSDSGRDLFCRMKAQMFGHEASVALTADPTDRQRITSISVRWDGELDAVVTHLVRRHGPPDSVRPAMLSWHQVESASRTMSLHTASGHLSLEVRKQGALGTLR